MDLDKIYNIFFLDKYIKTEAVRPMWQLELEFIFVSSLLICASAPFLLSGIVAGFPDSHLYISSLFPNPSNFYTLMFIAIPINFFLYLVLCSPFTSMVFALVSWIYMKLFILKELQ